MSGLWMLEAEGRLTTVVACINVRSHMIAFSLRKFRILGALVFLGLVFILAQIVSDSRFAKRFDLRDKSFAFKMCEITNGTNHTVFSGNKLLGMINRQISRRGFRPISSDFMWTRPAGQNCTLLSVVFTFRGDVFTLNTNGLHYPQVYKHLDAAIVGPTGRILSLKDNLNGWNPYGKEHSQSWFIPDNLTNLVGYELHFSRTDEGKSVATYRL